MVAPLEKVCIGYLGSDYLFIRIMVVWVSRTSHLLMWRCLVNRDGNFKLITLVLCLVYSKHDIFHSVIFWVLGLDLIPAMYGEVYLTLKLWLSRVLDGGLVLVLVFLCLVLRGLKTMFPSQHKALFMRHLLMSKFKTLSNHRQRFGMLL